MTNYLGLRFPTHEKKREKLKEDYRTPKGREYRRKYYLKNKEKLDTYSNQVKTEMRQVAISIGNCSKCFKEKENPKFKMCSKCREVYRRYNLR